MSSLLNIFRKIISTYRNFGSRAFVAEVGEILRYLIFDSRKYVSLALVPKDFIAPQAELPTTQISLMDPLDLVPYACEALELDRKFLTELKDTAVVVAKDSVTGDLLGYGFFSTSVSNIDVNVDFCPPQGSTYLFKFFVIPEARRERIARRLVAKIIEIQDRKFSDIFIVNIFANNFISMKAFTQMGFEQRKFFIWHEGQKAQWRY